MILAHWQMAAAHHVIVLAEEIAKRYAPEPPDDSEDDEYERDLYANLTSYRKAETPRHVI
jgi:hypothetical protein